MDPVLYLQLGLPLILVAVGFFSGTLVERRHYRSIERREEAMLRLPAVTTRRLADQQRADTARLVVGSVVVSIDYFKRLVAGLRNLVGGRVASYETLIDRARREALLRMKEQAPDADIILNVRVETSSIGGADGDGGVGSVEAIAYGTAVTFRR